MININKQYFIILIFSMNVFNNDVYEQLNTSGFNFKKKTCLDIGTRDGLNCISLIKLGCQHITGIDLNDSKFTTIDSYPEKEHVTLLKQDLLTYTPEIQFDVITLFLWNMHWSIYDDVIIKIKSLLKKNGTILIGFYDEMYKFGYVDPYTKKAMPNTGSVLELIRKHWNYSDYKILHDTSEYSFKYSSKPIYRCQWIVQITEYSAEYGVECVE